MKAFAIFVGVLCAIAAAAAARPPFLGEPKMFLDPEAAAGNWFGLGMEIGDWNGDGNRDIFISSFLADPDGVANAGAIHVFFGPDFDSSERITAPPEPEEGDNFGTQVKFRDMNGDGLRDLIVSGLRSRYSRPEDGAVLDQAGSIRLLYAPGFVEQARLFDEPPEANALMGRGLEIADVNGDGEMDILVTAIGALGGLGKVNIFYGPGYEERRELLSPVIENIRFGTSLAAGDWNRDGALDILVGSDEAWSSNNLPQAGHVQFWFGPEYREENVLVFEEPVPEAETKFGASLEFADITGDGVDDLIAGKARARWNGLDWVGQVQVFPGPDYMETILIDSPLREANAIFGSEVVVGDATGDGVNDLLVGEYFATVDGMGSAGRAWLFPGIRLSISDWSLR